MHFCFVCFFLVCLFLYLFERNSYLNLFNIHFILRYGSLCWIARFQDKWWRDMSSR